jgi:hypothetical protein
MVVKKNIAHKKKGIFEDKGLTDKGGNHEMAAKHKSERTFSLKVKEGGKR